MNELYFFLNIVVVGLSALLVLVSFVSFRRLRSGRLLLVSVAFLVFLMKGIFLLLGLIVQDERALMIDLVVLVLLYFSMIKK